MKMDDFFNIYPVFIENGLLFFASYPPKNLSKVEEVKRKPHLLCPETNRLAMMQTGSTVANSSSDGVISLTAKIRSQQTKKSAAGIRILTISVPDG